MACSSAPGPGTTSTMRARCITGPITSAACGIRIASMIATGSLSAIRGSMISMTMTGDLENSTSVILIVDAGSVRRGNFTDAILIVGGNSTADEILTTDAGSGKTMIEAGDTSAAKVVDAARVVGVTTDVDKSKVG